jgi:hypothetical protein
MVAANETDRIRNTLDQVSSSLPANPHVVGTQFDLGTDGTGDPAVYVVVLLDDATKDEDWTSPKLEPIADRFREELRAAGIDRWPYVRFAKPSDLKAAG